MATSPLTAREEQIRRMVVDGLTNEEIAARLDISARTVEAHVRMLFQKLNVRRRIDLVSRSVDSYRHPLAVGLDEKGKLDAEDGFDEVVMHRLVEELNRHKQRIASYEAAVQLMIDRQVPLFDERVEITLTVGQHGNEDMVVERHTTTPMPYLIYRVIRPITPAMGTVDYSLDSILPACEVVGQDASVAVQAIEDDDGRPRLLILFQPGLTQTTEWVLRYRTPGLWDPLREHGNDALRWSTGTLDGRRVVSIDDLTVHFVFPHKAASVDVCERRSLGTVEERQTDGARRRFTFRDQTRAGGRYEWLLSMTSQ